MSIDSLTLDSSSPFACLLDPWKEAISTVHDLWYRCIFSKNFELEGPRLSLGAIGGIAGINTTFAQDKRYAAFIQNLANNTHIYWTHNQSHGVALDILETYFLNYHGYSAPAKLLVKNWKKFDKEYKEYPDAKFFQLCYSQGASHVRNALENCKPPLRQRVIVLALAPAEAVPTALCYRSTNYSSRRDLICYGKFFSNPARIPEILQEFKEIHFIEPDPEAPLFDHSFQSPTFTKIVQDHLSNFLKTYG